MQRRYLATAGALAGLALLAAFVHVDAGEAKRKIAIKVFLPDEDAKVWVNGRPVKGTGVERTVKAAVPGDKDQVEVKTLWEPNNYTKITRVLKVDVKGKQEVTADLRKANPKMPDDIVVRYVPTPDVVVDAMCKMAKVGKNDVVFDLGCGNGVIVITALTKYGAKRGVGVDIDPERVADSNEMAKQHKVTDKVKFREGDVLKKIDDLGDASVIMLYMGEDINKRLKPILKGLKPGTRVVSHRFLMGDDWPPLRTETITGTGGETYDVHLWIIGKDKKEKE
jgi:uncharacterized protein (TIGR03000 family)